MSRLIAIGVILGALYAVHPGQPAPLPPCAEEDSTGCYWDAQHMGNGLGRSFIAYADGTIHYVTNP